MKLTKVDDQIQLFFMDNQSERQLSLDEVIRAHNEIIKNRIVSEEFIQRLRTCLSSTTSQQRCLANQINRIFGGQLPAQLNFLF